MPKVRPTQRQITTMVLFGDKLQPVKLSELQAETGIPFSTLARWKKDPYKMPLSGALLIARARKLSSDEWGKMLGGAL